MKVEAHALSENAVCCKTVRAIANFVRRKGLDHSIAFAICGLLLFFAVGTKVAAYHPNRPGARPIVATKVWQAKQLLDSETADAQLTSPTALTLVLLFNLCLMAVPMPRRSPSLSFHRLRIEGLPSLAVRPPPVV